MSTRLSHASLVWICLLTLFLLSNGWAKKPEQNRKLEMATNEVEETYRFENMRVSKETGAPVAVYRVNFKCEPGTPEEMAAQYLRENSAKFKFKPDLATLSHTRTIETPGGFHVRYRQTLGGYPVYNSDLVVNLDRHNTVTFVMNNYKPLAALKDLSPRISLAAARQTAKNYLKIRGKINYEKQETVVYYHSGVTRLAHRVVIVPAEEMFGDWEVLVDAQSGEIFRVEDKAFYGGPRQRATGSGWVFDPDPLTHARASYQAGGQFGDNNDADTDSLTAHTVQRDLLDIEFDGTNYKLSGPYAQIVDSEAPFNGLFTQTSSDWHFNRNASAFEAANVYYHLDASMRYINETLGFTLMPFQYSGGVKGDPHGLNGDDNSHYIGSTGQLAWGEGGVDDSEDADVILHELGHGIHDWLTNGSLSQVDGLSEGSGDYWANSYNRSKGFWTPADAQYYWTFQWDGHNEYWPGRITNYTAHYPGGLVGQIHTDGQIWASTLMQIWDDIGREATDANFLEALSMTNSSASQEDAAQAFVQADVNLHGGANLGVITMHFTDRGYNITVPTPQINHTPLTDTEDVNGPYLVTADITAGSPLATVRLIYGTDGIFSDTLDMAHGVGTIYSASIPGTGAAANYNYYILAVDDANLAATDPAGAPGNFHAFSTGTDNEAPVISHTPLGDQALVRWPATVTAQVTDNLGVASVTVEYLVNSGALSGFFSLSNIGGDTYQGDFDLAASALAVGDSVEYRIVATDASSQSNQTIDPASGFHGFKMIDVLGSLLIIDDDPGTGKIEMMTEKGFYQRDPAVEAFGASANLMETYLSDLGYLVTVETPAATDPATWDSYDLIISSSGFNVQPVTNSAYRTALENWVSDPAHKLLIEGGEVGYDATTSPGYSTFAANVLHSSDWVSDNAGALNQLAAQGSHPMVTTPNVLPASLSINYSDWASEDAVDAVGSAYLLYETANNPANAGISIFDDNSDPASAQIVYFAFNFAHLADQNAAADLLENGVKYLLTSETSTASMAMKSGWNMISLPLSVADGNYQTLFPNAVQAPFFYNGTYQSDTTMSVDTGYWINLPADESVAIQGAPIQSSVLNLTQGWNLVGGPSCSVAVTAIDDPGGIIVGSIFGFNGVYFETSSIDQGNAYWAFANAPGTITLNCTGALSKAPRLLTADLSRESAIEIRDAGGNSQRLYFNAKLAADQPIEAFRLPPVPPANIFDVRFKNDFRLTSGEAAEIRVQANRYPLSLRFSNLKTAQGEQYFVKEMAGSDAVATHPVLEGQEIVISNPQVTRLQLGVSVANLPTKFSVEQNYPNPFNPTTEIRYALPQQSDVRVIIYNTLGQKVRALVSKKQDAGFYNVTWNGKNDQGQAIASGIYLYRVTAGSFLSVKKMILLK